MKIIINNNNKNKKSKKEIKQIRIKDKKKKNKQIYNTKKKANIYKKVKSKKQNI